MSLEILANMPSDSALTDAKRAEYCLQLADRAAKRIVSRRTWEWRMVLSLWSGFGGGAILVVGKDLNPIPMVAIIGTVTTVMTVSAFCFIWLRYNRIVTEDDKERGIGWEKKAMELAKLADVPNRTSNHVIWRLHCAQWMQLMITVFFAVSFIGALWVEIEEKPLCIWISTVALSLVAGVLVALFGLIANQQLKNAE